MILRHSVSTSIPLSPPLGASLGSRHEPSLHTFYDGRPLSLMSAVPSPHSSDLVRKCFSCELQTLPPWGCTHSPRLADHPLKDTLEVEGFLPSESSWETDDSGCEIHHLPHTSLGSIEQNSVHSSPWAFPSLGEGRKAWCYWLKVQSGELTVKNPHEWLVEEAELRWEWSPSGPRLSDAM